MKKLLILALLFVSINLLGQISEGGLPPSFRNTMAKSKAQIVTLSLSELDTAQLLAYDRENPSPMRYSVISDVSVDIKKSGTRTYLDSYKGSIWRYMVCAKEAKSVQILFEKYRVPDRAQLFIYDENYSLIRGAFTSMNITEDLSFVLSDFPGDNLIIEYFEPDDSSFEGELIIGGIGQSYVDIFEVKSTNADSYNLINVNCEEGKAWQDQKHSVCKITYNDGAYGYLCTGAFINNTNNDGKPYFLTANHCLSSNTVAGTVVAHFNYETAGCSNTSIYTAQTLTGSTLKTTSAGSDYTLLLFNNNIPASYNPYYAGWDVTGMITDSTAGIHHPKGWIKKISIDHGPTASNYSPISWQGGTTSEISTHWAVTFDEGTTYGGSSGSPLFDENKRIIGQLHGGGDIDYYGKLSYSWNHTSASFNTLQSFLDPTSSNVEILNAYYPATNTPDPQFISGFNTVCVSSPVELTSYSAFSPTGWQWSFDPASVTYHNGTTANSQNPMVSFNNAGTYDITLTATNAGGSASHQVFDFMTAGTNLNIKAFPEGISDSCACSFTGVELRAFGADAYQWALSGDAINSFNIDNVTANPVKVTPKDPLTASTNLTLTLTGTQGSCSNTINFTLPLLSQPNDHIADAILLTPSTTGPYNNKCASIDAGEPEPPHTSCTSQMSWCDEYGTGQNLAENTLWFRYVPPTAQSVEISTTGLDDQLAVYRADSYSDVLSGNYTLVAANDDFTETDFNAHVIVGMAANQNYWIQVDGSGGGKTGAFYLKLSATNGIEDVKSSELNISVYPQPACDNVFIESPEFEGSSSVLVELYNASGSKVLTLNETEGDAKIEIPLSGLSSGIYFARIIFNEKRTTVKIIK